MRKKEKIRKMRQEKERKGGNKKKGEDVRKEKE